MSAKAKPAPDLHPGISRTYMPARKNPMFSELQRLGILFVRYKTAVPCALCGRRSRHHWTSWVRFHAADISKCFIRLEFGRKWFPRGAPVCRAHILELDEAAMRRLVREVRKKKP